MEEKVRTVKQGDTRSRQGSTPAPAARSRRRSVALAQLLRPALWLLGAALFAWALLDPRFRDAEGSLRGAFCLPTSLAWALLTLGWAALGRLRRPAFWFALALVGQAVALQMIEAGRAVRYQHYRSFDRLLAGTHPLLLMYLALQAVLVVAGLSRRWQEIRAWVGRTFRSWQLLCVGLAFFLSSATLSREVSAYAAELMFAAFVQIVNLGNVVLIAWALPEGTLAWAKRKLLGASAGVERIAVLAATWVTVLAAVLSFAVYERHPHVQDEMIYLYHARYLADGALTVPAPPVADAFSLYMIPYESNRWYSIFSPGWPAVLAIGVLFGVPWLVNPALAGLNVLLIYLLVGEIYDRRTARMAVLLLCASPWYIFMGMNFMAHTFTLTCALVASLGVAWARKTEKAGWAWLGGCAVGMVSLIRPLDGAIMAGLLGMWAIGIGGRRLRVPSIVAFAFGAIAVGALVLPYNRQVMGDPTAFPLMAYYEEYFGPQTNALGFGPERGLGWAIDPFPGHSPLEALLNADLNIFSVNVELFGWGTGSLVLALLLLFSGKMQRRDYLMLAVVVMVAGIYSLYWFSGGPDFGARYWYLMVVPLVALSVRGICFLEKTFEREPVGLNAGGIRAVVAVLSLSVLALVNYFPWRAVDKYHHYLGMRPDIRYLAKEYDFGRSLVLIRGDRFPDYASAWVYNPLDPHADAPVYAWDGDPEVTARVLAAYAERPVWIVNGPAVTHGDFEVIDGPLPARELTAEGSER